MNRHKFQEFFFSEFGNDLNESYNFVQLKLDTDSGAEEFILFRLLPDQNKPGWPNFIGK